jgi:hypothetical protein
MVNTKIYERRALVCDERRHNPILAEKIDYPDIISSTFISSYSALESVECVLVDGIVIYVVESTIGVFI